MTLKNAYELYCSIPRAWADKSDFTGTKGRGTKDLKHLYYLGWVEERVVINSKTKRSILQIRRVAVSV